jgi:hypothetical protein
MRKNIITAYLLVLTLSTILQAGNWPQFKRTPNRQGCNLAESVALPSKLCSWFDFNSPIHASPAVVDGKAYAVASDGLLARIDLVANRVDWHVRIGGKGNMSSPAVGNGKVYTGNKAGIFFVIDATSGAILKQYNAGAAIMAEPLLLDSGVYFGSIDARFHALDLNGNLKWTYQAKNYIVRGAASQSDTIIFTDGNDLLYALRDMGSSSAIVYIKHSYDQATVSTDAAPPSIDPFLGTPMIWKNGIFIGRGNQEYGAGAHRLTRYEFSTGQFSVCSGPTSAVFTTPSVDTHTTLVYAGSNDQGLFALRAGLGTWPDWTTTGQYFDTTGIWGVNSSPAVIANCIVFGSEHGELHFFQKDTLPYGRGYGGVQYWSYKNATGKAFDASPAVSDERVVIGSLDGFLYGFWDGSEVSKPIKVDNSSTRISNTNTQAQGRWTLTVSPNPAQGLSVEFRLPSKTASSVLTVHDISGAIVARLRTGNHGIVSWNLMDTRGKRVSAGSYYVLVKGSINQGFHLKVLP